jgi:hypothetical protein
LEEAFESAEKIVRQQHVCRGFQVCKVGSKADHFGSGQSDPSHYKKPGFKKARDFVKKDMAARAAAIDPGGSPTSLGPLRGPLTLFLGTACRCHLSTLKVTKGGLACKGGLLTGQPVPAAGLDEDKVRPEDL